MAPAVFKLKKNAVNRYFFTFRASNDAVIVTSKSYGDRASMEKSIACIREAVRAAPTWEKNQEVRRPYYEIIQVNTGFLFRLYGKNGETLAESISFAERDVCADCLRIFIETAADVRIIDWT